jgi:hypothetical protein
LAWQRGAAAGARDAAERLDRATARVRGLARRHGAAAVEPAAREHRLARWRGAPAVQSASGEQ